MDVHRYSVKKVLGELLFRLAKTGSNLIFNKIIIIMALVIITVTIVMLNI